MRQWRTSKVQGMSTPNSQHSATTPNCSSKTTSDRDQDSETAKMGDPPSSKESAVEGGGMETEETTNGAPGTMKHGGDSTQSSTFNTVKEDSRIHEMADEVLDGIQQNEQESSSKD